MFRIGLFARLCQVSVSALRYYDEIGLLKPSHVDRFTGYRYYTADQVPRLNRITSFKELGLSLEAIDQPLAQNVPTHQLSEMLRRKESELEGQIGEYQEQLERVKARL